MKFQATHNSRIGHAAERVDLPEEDGERPHVALRREVLQTQQGLQRMNEFQ